MSSSRSGPVGVGIIGAGVIAGTYLENMTAMPDLKVLAVGDLFPEAAARRAEEHKIETHGGVDTVLDHPDVEIVVNLTVPIAHAEVALKAVAAGKHVYNEKPLSLDLDSARAVIKAATAAGLRVGCAPDTFLGAGLQAGLKMIRNGDIGTPLTALALMQSPGPESWHPNPAFLFQEGAGPLFDIGPYYLTTLVQTFGPASRFAAASSRGRAKRTIGSGPRAGEEFDVTVPTHHGSLTVFESGASAQSIFSFESALGRAGWVEITGTEATLAFPDPNTFAGRVRIKTRTADDWEVAAETTALSTRGTGVLDLARAIRGGTPHRASGELAFHVLDLMVCTAKAAESGEFVRLDSTFTPTDPLPDDWDPKASTL
ncbi:MAG: Gfo/Idh/MocA family protein [Propionibacteriaceae bacterium]